MAVKDADTLGATKAKDQSQNIALLIIALFLVVVYFLKEFSLSQEPAPTTPVVSSEQIVIEKEDAAGNSKVYVLFPKKSEVGSQGSEIKTGSKIKMRGDGSAEIGLMSGEKHLIFSIPLNINRATAQDFEAIPGIGPKLAEEIVATRERLGGFKTIDSLKKVKGIGDKKFEKIKSFVSVELTSPQESDSLRRLE